LNYFLSHIFTTPSTVQQQNFQGKRKEEKKKRIMKRRLEKTTNRKIRKRERETLIDRKIPI
jgi:hypothetical protein